MISQKTGRAKSALRTAATLVLISLSTFVMSLISLSIYANASTDPLPIEAQITGAMSIDCSGQEVNFGAIVASGVAGTITLDTSGAVADGGGATYVSGAVPGVCVLQGNVSAPYEVDYVVSPLTGPGVDMTLINLASNNANGDGPFAGLGTHNASLDAVGADALVFGGTLNVGANQTAGLYSGTIDVTVDYP
ncbi:MAG: DUF4402 domain-containing protein [Micavibrio sp.]